MLSDGYKTEIKTKYPEYKDGTFKDRLGLKDIERHRR